MKIEKIKHRNLCMSKAANRKDSESLLIFQFGIFKKISNSKNFTNFEFRKFQKFLLLTHLGNG